MRIIGKCPPEPSELQQAYEGGFDGVELYLTTEHLDAYPETVDACREAPVDIVSVHTPHVTHDGFDYLKAADNLAVEFDAFLCVHSMGFHLTNLKVLDEEVEFEAEHGFESHPGNNLMFIENTIFNSGRNFVLDTAHFYASEENYLEKMEYLFDEYGDSIKLIHLCDGTRAKDGLPFGEGTMAMDAVCNLITERFDGPVVIEVMPGHQETGREWLESI